MASRSRKQSTAGPRSSGWHLNDIDLVIIDINMPRLDGLGLIQELRAGERHRHRPILVLTTESSDEKRARARAAGATGWIVKPFNPDQLVTAIRRVSH